MHPLIERHIDEHFEDSCGFLAELVRVPTDNPPGDCAAHAEKARDLLEGLGFTVETDPVPAEVCAAVGMISATNLIVRESFGHGGPCIALNAHGDVVPPGLGWTQDPYGAAIADDGRHGPAMYGRGVAVSKSDFASYSYALLALKRLAADGHALNGRVELHFTYDEEVGGDIGPKRLIELGLTKPDYAIGAGFSYAVTTAHNGCLHLEVTVRGRQGHAAMPESGVDALAAATRVMQALYDFRASTLTSRVSAIDGIGHATLNIGLIEGGINTNVVPDRVTLRLDRRMIPEESPEAVEAELRTLIDAAARQPGIQVDIRRVLLALPLVKLPGAAKLTRALQTHGERIFHVPIGEHGVPLYTDARHYTAAGIPTVLYGAGPRTLAEAGGHNADEHLRLSDLRGATMTVACALADLLGEDVARME